MTGTIGWLIGTVLAACGGALCGYAARHGKTKDGLVCAIGAMLAATGGVITGIALWP